MKMKKEKDVMLKPVDVIIYGKREHYDTRKDAIENYKDCINCSEGSE